METNMYLINEIASLFGISTQAVRYYDKNGLLTPSCKNDDTGYRYYSDVEIEKLSNIVQLRYLGFSIEEIKQFLNLELSKEEKISKLRRTIEICTEQINRIETVLNLNSEMNLQLKERPEYITLHRKWHIDQPMDMAKYINKFINDIAKQKIPLHNPFCIFATNTGKGNVDSYIAVEKAINNMTEVLPAQKVATVIYKGNVRNSKYAYEYLYAEIKKQGLNVSGSPFEKYLGPYHPVTNSCATEIQIPVS